MSNCNEEETGELWRPPLIKAGCDMNTNAANQSHFDESKNPLLISSQNNCSVCEETQLIKAGCDMNIKEKA